MKYLLLPEKQRKGKIMSWLWTTMIKMWSVKRLYILTRKYSTAAILTEVTEDQIGYSDIMVYSSKNIKENWFLM